MANPLPLQFAVVREDPRVESWIVEQFDVKRALLVASGGCTALSLCHWHPHLELTLVDPNQTQLAHVQAKVAALQSGISNVTARRFNVDDDDVDGLSQCGMFEHMFDAFRSFLHAFVERPDGIAMWFDRVQGISRSRKAFSSAYWPIAFELHFSDRLLAAVFGPAAIQHAQAGSYATYFRKRLERALQAAEAHSNYFLHHIFLGRYLGTHRPAFLEVPSSPDSSSAAVPRDAMRFVEGSVSDVSDIERFDFVHLSNIFDWMDGGESQLILEHLARHVRPGARIGWRQLNNARDLSNWMQPYFECDPDVDAKLVDLDRSSFYEQVHLGVRRDSL